VNDVIDVMNILIFLMDKIKKLQLYPYN